MNKKILLYIVGSIVVIFGVYFIFTQLNQKALIKEAPSTPATKKTNLVYAMHWSQKDQTDGVYVNGVLKSKGLKQYLDEYTKIHPEIEFTVKFVPYGQYSDTLKVLSDADMAPDIYQIYSPWGASYVEDGILDTPPQDIKDDVVKNYISTDGVIFNNQIWGIPTEINTYSLLYNKDLFKKAGLVDTKGNILYPKTWSEFVNTAVKLTKRDSKGNITEYGVAFSNEDWQVVDPFLCILFSNGGKYLSSDLKKSLFNSKEGVDALNAELALFKKGATDTNGNFYDFGKGSVAMVIAPPWTKSTFASNFGDKFESTVGVAPFPAFKSQTTLRYGWFMGVMNKSSHKQEAWDFLRWFTSEVQPGTNTTRYGDMLADPIGSIPSRKIDFESHKQVLGDFFTKVYVGQMQSAVSEPNVKESNKIKAVLLKEIQNAWSGKKTAKEALDNAAVDIDKILLSL